MSNAEEIAATVAEFDEHPFWKQVALLSVGLLWYATTRVLIPAVVVALVVQFVL